MILSISNLQARRLILHLQGLTRPPRVRLTSAELLSMIVDLGYVQVDSIQWVERAHHMILFARNQTYRPNHLKPLLENTRCLFEGWTHDASIIPSQFHPHWKHKFRRDEPRLRKKFINWQGDGFLGKCDDLHNLIAARGPTRSRDIDRPKSTGKQEMWQWHDGKAALEYLWRTGRLGISGRDGFQKYYDLVECCLQPEIHQANVSEDEFIDWACHSALNKLGFGTPADIARFWNLLSTEEVKSWIDRQSTSEIISIFVTGARKDTKDYYARPDIEALIADLPEIPKRVRALSPFDPVIRNRSRLEWLFGFDYRIEIYVPEARRKYGYYVFPLLEGDRLIGRVDMRADRKNNVLAVKKLWLEPMVKMSNARRNRIESELERMAMFTSMANVEWDSAVQA